MIVERVLQKYDEKKLGGKDEIVEPIFFVKGVQ
jgi:hypothetical protein